MPELPEIEHLRRTLEPVLVGAAVTGVTIKRRDVIHRGTGQVSRRHRQCELLVGSTITSLDRRGKQLAVLSDAGRALCVHLGMSGQLRYAAAGVTLAKRDHVHCTWRLRSAAGDGRLTFRDPRRFGGIWTFPDASAILNNRWSSLGPDALTITAAALAGQLSRTRMAIKAALLDQRKLAGVGNIYADEALYAAKVHPLSVSSALPGEVVSWLAASIRATLRRAIAAGGSTLRDYADGNGEAGWFAVQHRVYGRAGQPCRACRGLLTTIRVVQRTTTYCQRCQRWYG